MVDVILHTGAEHPNLLWILAAGFLSFLTGLGLNMYSDHLKKWRRSKTGEETD